MISPGLLAYLRSVSELAMPDAAAILRYVETNGPDGPSQDWQTVASGIPCRVDAHRQTALERPDSAGVFRAVSDWVVHLPALTDVTVRDRIVITGADRPDGRTFEVSDVGEQSYEVERELRCVLVA